MGEILCHRDIIHNSPYFTTRRMHNIAEAEGAGIPSVNVLSNSCFVSNAFIYLSISSTHFTHYNPQQPSTHLSDNVI